MASRSKAMTSRRSGGGGNRTPRNIPTGASVNAKPEQGRPIRDDYSDRPPVGNDDTPESAAPEASRAAPTIRRNLAELDLEAMAGDVRIGAARVSGNCRDDAKHRLTWCDRDQAQVVGQRLVGSDHERHALVHCGRGVARDDRDVELRERRSAPRERDQSESGESFHARPTPPATVRVHRPFILGGRNQTLRKPPHPLVSAEALNLSRS